MSTTVQVKDRGPLMVEGDFELRAANGEVLVRAIRVALCRCGASARKPFCDGSHNRVGFGADDEPKKEEP
jgi:CDGSH-type Zn-finger protein